MSRKLWCLAMAAIGAGCLISVSRADDNDTYNSVKELEAKRTATTYDEVRGIHYVDNDVISEWRVKRCLLRWNFHRKLRNFCKRLHRSNNQLTTESWEDFRRLPPLVRKVIVNKLWRSLGAP